MRARNHARALTELHHRLADQNIALHLATIRGPVRDLLTRATVWQPLREAGHVHRDISEALAAVTGKPPVEPQRASQEVL